MATIIGSAGNDQLAGTAAGDFIEGGAGNDKLSGLAGDDTLKGEDGNDTLNGGDGHDWLFAGDGDNLVYGGAGNDSVVSLFGRDSIVAGDGDDFVVSGEGSDTLQGGNGQDSLYSIGGVGTGSLLDGGDDDDFLVAEAGNNQLIGGRGNDWMNSFRAGNSTLRGGAGDDGLLVWDKTVADSVLMDGGEGADFLGSSAASESYLFGRGYGSDTVFGAHEEGVADRGEEQFMANDKVLLGSNLAAADLALDIVKQSEVYTDETGTHTLDRWHLDIKIKNSADSLRIMDYLTDQPLDRGVVQFSNGSRWTYADIVARVGNDPDYQDFLNSGAQAAQLVGALAAFDAPAGAISASIVTASEGAAPLLAAV